MSIEVDTSKPFEKFQVPEENVEKVYSVQVNWDAKLRYNVKAESEERATQKIKDRVIEFSNFNTELSHVTHTDADIEFIADNFEEVGDKIIAIPESNLRSFCE